MRSEIKLCRDGSHSGIITWGVQKTRSWQSTRWNNNEYYNRVSEKKLRHIWQHRKKCLAIGNRVDKKKATSSKGSVVKGRTITACQTCLSPPRRSWRPAVETDTWLKKGIYGSRADTYGSVSSPPEPLSPALRFLPCVRAKWKLYCVDLQRTLDIFSAVFWSYQYDHTPTDLLWLGRVVLETAVLCHYRSHNIVFARGLDLHGWSPSYIDGSAVSWILCAHLYMFLWLHRQAVVRWLPLSKKHLLDLLDQPLEGTFGKLLVHWEESDDSGFLVSYTILCSTLWGDHAWGGRLDSIGPLTASWVGR